MRNNPSLPDREKIVLRSPALHTHTRVHTCYTGIHTALCFAGSCVCLVVWARLAFHQLHQHPPALRAEVPPPRSLSKMCSNSPRW